MNRYSYMEKQENPNDIYYIYRNKRKESLAKLNLQAAANNIENAAAGNRLSLYNVKILL